MHNFLYLSHSIVFTPINLDINDGKYSISLYKLIKISTLGATEDFFDIIFFPPTGLKFQILLNRGV